MQRINIVKKNVKKYFYLKNYGNKIIRQKIKIDIITGNKYENKLK